MQVQDSTLELIKGFESLSLTPYQDEGGVWTIGYGFTYINGVAVTPHTPALSLDQAENMLKSTVQRFADAVNALIDVAMTQNQFDAMVSLCFNIGMGLRGFEGSTVRKDMNLGNVIGAADAFLMWDMVNGKPSAGLLKRRKIERALFLS